MHPRRSAQHVLLCDLCTTVSPQRHCELCHVDLCTNCVGTHISDSSRRHNVVPYKHRKSTSYPKCPKHADKHCELYCEECSIPVCSTCVSSGKHKGHNISDVLKTFSFKSHGLQNDLKELESRIYPRYEEMASDVQTEKDKLQTNYEELTTATDQQGEVLHQEITAIVNQQKFNIEEMKNKHLAVLNKHKDEITQSIKELKRIIQDLKKILHNNDVSLAFTYKSKNAEFRKLPSTVRILHYQVFLHPQ
ncbi:tripartite motif-containing protein 45-like [Ostrea edulis]|uniref:tripartite motif-containing protein 45-like n=1 Tax=Ostrea edulis TaxID=37623 RepID=UPI0024AEE14D|nr:tripartite motif-containing protein 45-like [Ostrea edulis]